MSIIFWKKKTIKLGEQNVSEITVLEWKKLFSIKLFNFHKTYGKQDRFHTHSFNSVSFLFFGNYIEEIIQDGKIVALNRNRSRFICIPKNEYHRITKSEGCRTILITGPWSQFWKELRELGNSRYQEVTQTYGRVDVSIGEIVTLSY
jgi:hypothetical protein